MLKEEPYFLKNEEWYYHDKKKNRYFLTDKAPEEAKRSYEEHYKQLDAPDPVFYYEMIITVEKEYREDLKKEGKTPEEIEQIIDDWKSKLA